MSVRRLLIFTTRGIGCRHRWELSGNYPVFTMVMAIYHYIEIIGELLLPVIFCIAYINIKTYYPGEIVNIYIYISLYNTSYYIGFIFHILYGGQVKHDPPCLP